MRRTVLTLLLLLAASPLLAGTPPRLTLIFSGNLNGELEPCGCTVEGDLGGIKRRTTMVDRLRKKDPALVLVSTGGLLASEAAEDRLTGRYILKGLQALDYDAIGVQWQDLAFGTGFIAGHKLPWVATNWRDAHFSKERDIRRGPVRIAFFDWLAPKASPVTKQARRQAPGPRAHRRAGPASGPGQAGAYADHGGHEPAPGPGPATAPPQRHRCAVHQGGL